MNKLQATKKLNFLKIKTDNLINDQVLNSISSTSPDGPAMALVYIKVLVATLHDGWPGAMQYGENNLTVYIADRINDKHIHIINSLIDYLRGHGLLNESIPGAVFFTGFGHYINSDYYDMLTPAAYNAKRAEHEKEKTYTVRQADGSIYSIDDGIRAEWRSRYSLINTDGLVKAYCKDIQTGKIKPPGKPVKAIAGILRNANQKEIEKKCKSYKPTYSQCTRDITVLDYTYTAADINTLQAKYKFINVEESLENIADGLNKSRKKILAVKSAVTAKLRTLNNAAMEDYAMAKSSESEEAECEVEEANPEKSANENWAEFISIYPSEKQKNATNVEKARSLFESYSTGKQAEIVEAAKKYTAKGMPVQYMSSIVDFVVSKYSSYASKEPEHVKVKLSTGCKDWEALGLGL